MNIELWANSHLKMDFVYLILDGIACNQGVTSTRGENASDHR